LAHRLINAGNTTDTYTIETSSEQGWPVSIIVPAGNTVTLLPNANFPVEVRVQVPADVAPGTIDRISVRVVSQNDPSVTATVVSTLFYPSTPQQTVQPYKVALPLVVK
ncbi:MAG TPA: FixG Ig-like domain-containing protein, partial [Roseiflexaceae bacterium]|nr:FixG Ig-like domain-containing protein [Roseiflexaceae bacterium]